MMHTVGVVLFTPMISAWWYITGHKKEPYRPPNVITGLINLYKGI